MNNKRPKGQRFALLCRVSTRGQSEGESLDVQEKQGREYVKRQLGRVVKVYRGIESATKAAQDRVLLQSVLHDVKARAFNALWVLDKSRLARSAGAVEMVG